MGTPRGSNHCEHPKNHQPLSDWGFLERSYPCSSILWTEPSPNFWPLCQPSFLHAKPIFPLPQVPWLHAIYAVLGAGVFTLVSLAQPLGSPSQLCDSLLRPFCPVSSLRSLGNLSAASEGRASAVPHVGNSVSCPRLTL